MKLSGKNAFITGGTGHLGEKIALEFAANGADVIFTYNTNSAKADDLCRRIEAGGRKAMAVKMDVTSEKSVAEGVAAAAGRFGRIDILVNNAGVTQVMPLPLIEAEDWDETFSVNVKGCFLVTKEVARLMIGANAGGSIINMGSVAGLRMLEVPVHYAASKAAIHGFTFALARELTRYKIRVNCIAPGLLEGGVGANIAKKQYDDFIAHCSAGRPGRPEEVAKLAVFLASDDASYINSQILVCDGGL